MGREHNLSYRCKKEFQKCCDEWVTCVFQEKNHTEIMGQGKGRSMRGKISWEEPRTLLEEYMEPGHHMSAAWATWS